MCGIAGFVVGDGSSKEISHRSLVTMTRALVHRGPDDEGYYWRPNVGLGSRRLSIIDLSTAGRMPLYNETRTVAVVQNGEIYNFKSLRRDLIAKGHRFLSDTDTEIVVHLYEEVGTRCLNTSRACTQPRSGIKLKRSLCWRAIASEKSRFTTLKTLTRWPLPPN